MLAGTTGNPPKIRIFTTWNHTQNRTRSLGHLLEINFPTNFFGICIFFCVDSSQGMKIRKGTQSHKHKLCQGSSPNQTTRPAPLLFDARPHGCPNRCFNNLRQVVCLEICGRKQPNNRNPEEPQLGRPLKST